MKSSDLASSIGDDKARDQPREPGAQSVISTATAKDQEQPNSVAEDGTEPATSEVQSQIKADELQTQNDGSSGESVKGGLTDSQAFLDESAKDPINGVAEGSTEQATSEPQSQTGKADQIKQAQNGGGTGEFAGRGPTTNSSSEEVSQLVSGIRIARDQLDKLLDCYGQGRTYTWEYYNDL